ncbi:MAG: histidine phosphatase family protein [Caldilineaceae bacterium]|nr:histidine phosphatase family protein [Caldilineaceae bacterium]
MKTLSIVRHAKAETAGAAAADFRRPLTARGKKDARHIGRLLARIEPAIDWIIASPSARTRSTVAAMVEIVDYSGTLQWEERAYLGEAETWLQLLSAVPPEIEHVALVGHNPGIAELVAGLTSGVPSRLNLHFPTAAVAHLAVDIFWWNQIRWGCGELRMLITPKYLRKK